MRINVFQKAVTEQARVLTLELVTLDEDRTRAAKQAVRERRGGSKGEKKRKGKGMSRKGESSLIVC